MAILPGQPNQHDAFDDQSENSPGGSPQTHSQDPSYYEDVANNASMHQVNNTQAHIDYGATLVQNKVLAIGNAEIETYLASANIENNDNYTEDTNWRAIKKLCGGWDKKEWKNLAVQLAKDKKSLEGEKRKLAEEKRKLAEEKRKLIEENAKLSNKIDQRSRQQSNDLARKGQEYGQLLEQKNRLHYELDVLKRNQANSQRNSLLEWQKRESTYEKTIKRLEMQDEERGKRVQEAQKAAQVMMDQNKSFALSDDEIRAQLKARADNWYGWSKDVAFKKLQCITQLTGNDEFELTEALKPFAKLHDGQLPRDLERGRKPNSVPYILLHAMLADFITSEIFATPYWILKACADMIEKGAPNGNVSNQELAERMSKTSENASASNFDKGILLAEAISSLLDCLTTFNEREAQQWRAQLVQFFMLNGMGDAPLDSESLTSRSVPKSIKERMVDVRSQYASILARKFLNGPARYLLDPGAPDHRQGRLEEEMNLAMQLSARLWSQRSRVGCLGLCVLHSTPFSISRDDLEAHQSQEKDIDPPTFYDGLPIGVVVQPAIVAFGTEEGQGYSVRSRVWLKARVWVDGTLKRQEEGEPAKQRKGEKLWGPNWF